MRKILVFLHLLITCIGFSQSRALDSLKKLIDNDKKEDSVKVKMLYEYSGYLYSTALSSLQQDYDKSIHYTRACIKLANKINRPDLAF